VPVYCYRRVGDGELVEIDMSVQEMKERQDTEGFLTLEDGTEVQRDYQAEHASRKAGGEAWPMLSEGMGVHPSQIQEMMAQARAKGVPTDFTADGRAILRTPRHRKQFGEAFRYYDKDGGYADPQRR